MEGHECTKATKLKMAMLWEVKNDLQLYHVIRSAGVKEASIAEDDVQRPQKNGVKDHAFRRRFIR